MKRRLFAVLTALALAGAVLPVPAAASAALPADVPAGAWYAAAAARALESGTMTTVDGGRFAPGSSVTRAELAAALCRLSGGQQPEGTAAFSDVPASAPYYDAVQWAAAAGVVSGYGDGRFKPETALTRQAMAVMLQRWAAVQGRDTARRADLTDFADAPSAAGWSASAVSWAVAAGLLSGTADGKLLPDVPVTRAQLAEVLRRCETGETLEKRSAAYVGEFLREDFAGFYAGSAAAFRSAVTQEQLLTSWRAVLQALGTPGGILSSAYTCSGGTDTVRVTVAFTLYNITVTIPYGADGTPSGLWTQYAPKDPPAPQSAEQWTEEAVTVGSSALPGLLTLPRGVEKPPVVILVQGSGASDLNESIGTAPLRPFEDLAHGLAQRGIATLRYNKRTYQNPTVGGSEVTIQYEVLDDASAAVELMSTDSRVDGGRIYLLGHSLGGMLAPRMAADNPRIRGIISLAGSLRTLQDIMLDQNAAAISAQTALSEQERAAQLAQVTAEIDKTRTLDDGGTGMIMGVPTNYWRSLNAADSRGAVQQLTIPMLILQGGADFQVSPQKDYTLWQTALAGRDNVTFHLYDGLSHLFMTGQIAADGVPDITLYNAPNHVAPEVISDIASWVAGLKN
ncbi:MAG: alpha/beta fold hydrolase [Oscillibacter sp.]|nr:alpha/beta fold hydrolase [Oscillibacter sp.]